MVGTNAANTRVIRSIALPHDPASGSACGGWAVRRFAVDGLCRRGDNGFGNEMKLGIDSRFGPHRLLTGKAFLSYVL